MDEENLFVKNQEIEEVVNSLFNEKQEKDSKEQNKSIIKPVFIRKNFDERMEVLQEKKKDLSKKMEQLEKVEKKGEELYKELCKEILEKSTRIKEKIWRENILPFCDIPSLISLMETNIIMNYIATDDQIWKVIFKEILQDYYPLVKSEYFFNFSYLCNTSNHIFLPIMNSERLKDFGYEIAFINFYEFLIKDTKEKNIKKDKKEKGKRNPVRHRRIVGSMPKKEIKRNVGDKVINGIISTKVTETHFFSLKKFLKTVYFVLQKLYYGMPDQ